MLLETDFLGSCPDTMPALSLVPSCGVRMGISVVGSHQECEWRVQLALVVRQLECPPVGGRV